MEPLGTGLEWELDPAENANSHDGRTIRRDMRAIGDSGRLMIVKRPKPELMAEIYSIGMERIAYCLGELLGLPMLETYLETVGGHLSSLQRRIPQGRSWRQRSAMMRANVTNEDIYVKAALFDVWLGNVDRRDVNLLFEPLPDGATPGAATGSQMWLIDHGCCGLWPPRKIDVEREPMEVPDDPGAITGKMRAEAEVAVATMMPAEYRKALKYASKEAREPLLDAVREVGDDSAIDSIVREVPTSYMTGNQGAATAAFLKARRDGLDEVLNQYW